jgi:phosphoglucomutase
MLSFAVRYMKAAAGIVITASHNPKEYNGYKVYGSDGGQITDLAAKEILACIEKSDYFGGTKVMSLSKALEVGLLKYIGEDVDQHYFERIILLSIRKELIAEKADQLKIIYSPLHGSGNIPVRRILKELGFSNVLAVPEQEKPDGSFPTTPYPNPEDPSVFDFAIKMAETAHPDLIFATDPDCDRLGVLVKDEEGKYSVLTGNQTGVLLCDYIIRSRRELDMMPERPAVIKTIVTTDLAKNICERNGVPIFDVLTGFKYIGELAEKWQNTGGHSFIFGFEESYGYLAGDFVRDKDAVIAAAQIAEMALYYKDKGQTLFQALQSLYAEYGYYAEKLISVEMPGEEGQKHCAEIIADMRANYKDMLNGTSIAVVEDYKKSEKTMINTGEREKIELPRSNVLKFIFDDESWLVLRPSGTEPKVKIYISARGENAQEAESKLYSLEKLARGILK